MNEIELLKKEHVKWIANEFDKGFDFKELIKNKIIGAAVESFDDKGAEMSLNFGNKRVSVFIPDEYKDEIHNALDDIMNGDHDYKVAIANAIDIIDQLKEKLNVKPFIKSLLDSLLEMIKSAIYIYLDSKEA